MAKFGRFNISDKPATQKGKPPTVRLLSPDHSDYHFYFDEKGRHRTREKTKELFEKELKKMASCKRCNHEIYFLRTKNNLLTPVNVESMHEDEINFIKEGNEVSFDSTRHISHFATCPDATSFRKRKPKS